MVSVNKKLPRELNPDSEYIVRARSVNAFGNASEWSESLFIDTSSVVGAEQKIRQSGDNISITSEDGKLVFGIYTSTDTRTNLVKNPSFETNLTGWSLPPGSTSTLSRPLNQSFVGSYSAKIQPTVAGTDLIGLKHSSAHYIPVDPGKTYIASAHVYRLFDNSAHSASSETSLFDLIINYYDLSNQPLVSLTVARSIQVINNKWTRIKLKGITVPTAAKIGIEVKYSATNSTNLETSEYILVDAVSFEEADDIDFYFDGSFIPGTTTWTGTAHGSTSVFDNLTSSFVYIGGDASITGSIDANAFHLRDIAGVNRAVFDTGGVTYDPDGVAIPNPSYSNTLTFSGAALLPDNLPTITNAQSSLEWNNKGSWSRLYSYTPTTFSQAWVAPEMVGLFCDVSGSSIARAYVAVLKDVIDGRVIAANNTKTAIYWASGSLALEADDPGGSPSNYNGNIFFKGNSWFDRSVTFQKATTFNDPATFGDTATFNGTTTMWATTFNNTVNINNNAIQFNSVTGNKLNLYGTDYKIGIASSTMFYDSSLYHIFYSGGVEKFTVHNTGTTTYGNVNLSGGSIISNGHLHLYPNSSSGYNTYLHSPGGFIQLENWVYASNMNPVVGLASGNLYLDNGYMKVDISGRKFKENIAPLDIDSGLIIDGVTPVSFTLKNILEIEEDDNISALRAADIRWGFIAEDVAEVEPTLGLWAGTQDGTSFEAVNWRKDHMITVMVIELKNLRKRLQHVEEKLAKKEDLV